MREITREVNQTIHIGREIKIRVLKAGNGRVRLSIDAPDGTRIIPFEPIPEPTRKQQRVLDEADL